MDQPEDQKHQAVDHFNVLKRTLKRLMPVTLFSFFLCFFSGFSLLHKSFFIFFNTCLFSFLTHAIERKYMFLICNVILAILAKSSVSCKSSPLGSDLGGQLSTSNNLSDMTAATIDQEILVASTVASLENVALVTEEEDKEADKMYTEKIKSETRGPLLLETDGKEEERENLVKQEEEEEEEEEEESNTEDLNRRFEEFIRKMKEELRIEAQRQPIAV